MIFLTRAMGALQIPIDTYHRSQSNKERSIVLNQPTRDEIFDPKQEFSPVSLSSNKQLKKARAVNPVYWIWKEDKIKRVTVDYENSSLKNILNSNQAGNNLNSKFIVNDCCK